MLVYVALFWLWLISALPSADLSYDKMLPLRIETMYWWSPDLSFLYSAIISDRSDAVFVIFESLFFSLYSICVFWTLAPIHVIKWREFFAQHLKMTSPGLPFNPWPCLLPVDVLKGLYTTEIQCLHWLFPAQHLKVKEHISLGLAARCVCRMLFCCMPSSLLLSYIPCQEPFGMIWPNALDSPSVVYLPLYLLPPYMVH